MTGKRVEKDREPKKSKKKEKKEKKVSRTSKLCGFSACGVEHEVVEFTPD